MILDNDKFLVTTDGNQFILQSKYIVEDSVMLKDKSKIGTVAVSSEKRFFSSLSGLFYGLVKYRLLEDDKITSFESILDAITDAKAEIDTIAQGQCSIALYGAHNQNLGVFMTLQDYEDKYLDQLIEDWPGIEWDKWVKSCYEGYLESVEEIIINNWENQR